MRLTHEDAAEILKLAEQKQALLREIPIDLAAVRARVAKENRLMEKYGCLSWREAEKMAAGFADGSVQTAVAFAVKMMTQQEVISGRN